MKVKRNRKLSVVIIVLFLIAVVACAGYFHRKAHADDPSVTAARLSEVYPASDGCCAVVANGVLSKISARWYEGAAYLPLSVVIDEIDEGFYWSSVEGKLYHNTFEKTEPVVKTSSGGILYFVDGDAATAEDDHIYVSVDYIAQVSDIYADTYTDTPRVFIRNKFGTCVYGRTLEGAVIRTAEDIKADVLATPSAGTELWIIEENYGWYLVYAAGEYGQVGYIRDTDVANISRREVSGPNPASEAPHIRLDGDIVLAWQQTFTSSGYDGLPAHIERATGLSVIAPTWFSIIDTEGTISSRTSAEYVEKAHEAGLQVWVLVENINTTESIDYQQLFGSSATRSAMISQLVSETTECGADGINVDVEGLPSAAGDDYIQFLRELTIACHKEGLSVSVDNYVPSAWTSHYHRDTQAEFIDYFIIMAYDEHYNGSEAGSTSSISFVDSGIADTIAAGVPADMIIVGLPFYSRLWKGDGSTLSSETISMDDMKALLEDTSVTSVWDSECAQYYVYFSENELYRCWIENYDSLAAKLDAAANYDVAGIAGWKLGMDNSEAWQAIGEYLEK